MYISRTAYNRYRKQTKFTNVFLAKETNHSLRQFYRLINGIKLSDRKTVEILSRYLNCGISSLTSLKHQDHLRLQKHRKRKEIQKKIKKDYINTVALMHHIDRHLIIDEVEEIEMYLTELRNRQIKR